MSRHHWEPGQPGSMVGGSGAGANADARSGYLVVTAGCLETAVALAKGCPRLQAGGRLEVGEILEM